MKKDFSSGLAWVVILTGLSALLMEHFKPMWISSEQALESSTAILFCALAIAIFRLKDRLNGYELELSIYVVSILYGIVGLLHFILPEYTRDILGVKEKFYTALIGLGISLLHLTSLVTEKTDDIKDQQITC